MDPPRKQKNLTMNPRIVIPQSAMEIALSANAACNCLALSFVKRSPLLLARSASKRAVFAVGVGAGVAVRVETGVAVEVGAGFAPGVRAGVAEGVAEGVVISDGAVVVGGADVPTTCEVFWSFKI